MTNGEVCKFVCNLKDEKYLAYKCVANGYGQSCGDYLTSSMNDGSHLNKPTEKENFLNYYGSNEKENALPSYQFLRCPQLLLYIAEISGVTKNR